MNWLSIGARPSSLMQRCRHQLTNLPAHCLTPSGLIGGFAWQNVANSAAWFAGLMSLYPLGQGRYGGGLLGLRVWLPLVVWALPLPFSIPTLSASIRKAV